MDTPYVAISLEVVGSTQDEARSRFEGRPILVTAERQTAGRGRTGAAWEQAERAVAASLAFRPDWPSHTWSRLTLVSALAVLAAVDRPLRLAWPNDLMLGGEKVGGLIAEATGDAVAVGLGLNLFWPDPIEGAGALFEADPGPDAARRIARSWATGLLRRTARGPEHWGIDEYRTALETLDCDVVWEPDGSGRAVDVAADGGLVVDAEGGRIVLHAGSVRRVRPVRRISARRGTLLSPPPREAGADDRAEG